MTKIRILEYDNAGSYKVAIHFPAPIGKSEAGTEWKACALASKMTGMTSLKVGVAKEEITDEEHHAIIAGDTIEIIRTIRPGIDPSDEAITSLCNVAVSEYITNMKRILRHYGRTVEVK